MLNKWYKRSTVGLSLLFLTEWWMEMNYILDKVPVNLENHGYGYFISSTYYNPQCGINMNNVKYYLAKKMNRQSLICAIFGLNGTLFTPSYWALKPVLFKICLLNMAKHGFCNNYIGQIKYWAARVCKLEG